MSAAFELRLAIASKASMSQICCYQSDVGDCYRFITESVNVDLWKKVLSSHPISKVLVAVSSDAAN